MDNKYQKPDYNSMPEAEDVAIWKRTSKSGNVFYSGVITVNGESVKFVAFPNKKYVEGGNHPILSYKKVDENAQPQGHGVSQNSRFTQSTNTSAPSVNLDEESNDIRIEDVPF